MRSSYLRICVKVNGRLWIQISFISLLKKLESSHLRICVKVNGRLWIQISFISLFKELFSPRYKEYYSEQSGSNQ